MTAGSISARMFLGQPEVLQANDFALAHRDAAIDLPEVFAKSDLVDQLFDFTKIAAVLQSFGPALHLGQALRVRRQPCQPMRSALVGLQ